MPARRTRAEVETTTLLEVMTDPVKYKKHIEELTSRRVAAEEAEAKASDRETRVRAQELNAAERVEHAAGVTANVNERRATLEADETALAERMVAIEKRETDATAMEALLVERNADIEDKINNALRSVGKLILDGLDVSYEEKLKETKP